MVFSFGFDFGSEIVLCKKNLCMWHRLQTLSRFVPDAHALPVEVAVSPIRASAPGKSAVAVLSEHPLPVIRFIDAIIEDACVLGASDVHLDPTHDSLKFRLRIDGSLQEFHVVPKQYALEVITRIKILAGLPTDEHQAALDGRFRSILSSGDSVDVRVAIAPTYHGEYAVLRLLSDTAEEFNLKTLGFSESNERKVLHALRRPFGMVLTTGPTGSGKTTTLYTLIKLLNSPERAIVTIEDPVEYAIGGINQIPVNPRTGLQFATGLRSILRQDPNVIMVGEIRDSETAGVAVNAALAGHLLLSTLHTNDAATALPRLLDLKVESYLIASTVSVVIAQRLVKKICIACKTKRAVSWQELENILTLLPTYNLGLESFYYGRGCDACNMTGYKGRIGIHEVFVIDEPAREAIMQKVTASTIKAIAVQSGMVSMAEDGLQKAVLGLTTIEEILKALYE